MSNQKVSCIIPAHNEAPRIENVLRSVAGHSLVDEVIVIDDASTDGTKDVAKKFSNIEIIEHKNNKGKSRTVADGLKAAKWDNIFLLDADLIGLTPDYITRLIEPVVSGDADISISLRGNSPWFSRLFGLDFISGERVFNKRLLAGELENIAKLKGFGVEVFMNRLIIAKKYRIKIVPWDGVSSPYPSSKKGFFGGVLAFGKMTSDIFKTVSPLGIVLQYIKMHRLIVRNHKK